MSITLNPSTGIGFNDGTTQGTAGYSGSRNKIINGAMRISQRGTSFSLSANGYSLDRWLAEISGGGVIGITQDSAAPTGFANSLKATVSTADSAIAAGDFYAIEQRIEGYNVADLAWGTSGAKPIAVSFWVRSSIAGNYGACIRNGATTRGYPFSYNISQANVFEYKTVTIPGDTNALSWTSDNTAGLILSFDLGSGSSYKGSSGAWQSANLLTLFSQTDWIATAGATFYLTGVQLEAGSVVTPFENRPIGIEAALCQRYYEKGAFFHVGYAAGTNNLGSTVKFAVSKRATPTITQTNVPASTANCSATTQNASTGEQSESFLSFRAGIAAGAAQFLETWTASAEL